MEEVALVGLRPAHAQREDQVPQQRQQELFPLQLPLPCERAGLRHPWGRLPLRISFWASQLQGDEEPRLRDLALVLCLELLYRRPR